MSSDLVLAPEHKRAWIAFFVAHAHLTKKIDRLMTEAGVVDMDVYDVLLNLEEASPQGLKMSDLAEAVIFSRSGVTRLVDRLEKEGLIERHACPNDRRRIYAVITPKGLEERKRAWPIYQKAIAELFAPHLGDGEAKTVADVFERMI